MFLLTLVKPTIISLLNTTDPSSITTQGEAMQQPPPRANSPCEGSSRGKLFSPELFCISDYSQQQRSFTGSHLWLFLPWCRGRIRNNALQSLLQILNPPAGTYHRTKAAWGLTQKIKSQKYTVPLPKESGTCCCCSRPYESCHHKPTPGPGVMCRPMVAPRNSRQPCCNGKNSKAKHPVK